MNFPIMMNFPIINSQQYKKPFDSPAVLVVGHQSSGKSALIEAIIGFQFNQVGGGTKTRRPVALKMQYNPKYDKPVCYLQGDDGKERPASLGEIQRYIESENSRLEKDKVRCFDSREINIRMEYKECPNMILIDTPGLISAPKTPKVSNMIFCLCLRPFLYLLCLLKSNICCFYFYFYFPPQLNSQLTTLTTLTTHNKHRGAPQILRLGACKLARGRPRSSSSTR